MTNPQQTVPLLPFGCFTGDLPILNIQVCILTYHRPHLLKLAIESVQRQSILLNDVFLAANGIPSRRIAVHLLIVDNDAAHSAQATALEAMGLRTLTCRYICEPRRGLSAARNCALDHSAEMDFLAFLDDDEAAYPDWLANLLHIALVHGADVASGPVEPRYIDSPQWVVRGGFFSAVRRATGTRVRCVASNNTLLRKGIVNKFRFDPRFDTTGGEDTEFFLRVGKAGYRMVWVDEARVAENIPLDRANVRWILKRAWSDANRFTISSRSVDPSIRNRLRRLIISAGGFLAGLLLLPGALLGWHRGVRALQLIYRAGGTFSGLRGRSASYYETTHG